MTKKHIVVGNQIFRKVEASKFSIHKMIEKSILPNPYEIQQKDVGRYIDREFQNVIPSDVGRRIYLRDDIIQMESMEQAETRRRKEGAPIGDPVELEFEDEEEEFEPDEDDAYMKPTGPLYSKIHLTVEGKSHGEFSSEEEAKDYLAKWTEANQFWPNLWYINDHGNVSGPILYGEAAEAGLGRQEGATYRQGIRHEAVYPAWNKEACQKRWRAYGKSMDKCIEKLKDEPGIRDAGALCAKIEKCATGHWPTEKKGWRSEPRKGSTPCVCCQRRTAEVLEQGRYVTLEKLPNGDLKMTATDEFRNEFLPYQNFDPEAYAEDERWGDNFNYYSAISDLIEDIRDNSEWDWVQPEMIGALTDAPIITDDMDYPDSGEVAPHPEANIWWYPNYAVRDFIDDLIRDGETVFTYVPAEEESVQASTRTAQEDFILPEENEGEFPFDVSLLDDIVTSTLREGRSEHDDFALYVDEVDASAVGDLDEVERTINDASVLTTVGGRYSLEIEGGMVNVIFEAEVDETDKLQKTFMSDDDGEEDIGNIEYED